MTQECKKQFTLRITQANKSELVVILYEIYFEYIKEAEQCFAAKNRAEFRKNIEKAHACLNELIGSLQLEYELGNVILSIYLFVARKLGEANGSFQTEPLKEADRVMKKLYQTYKEDSKTDTSESVMKHTQNVFAGLTYGKNHLCENMDEGSYNRGFLV